MLRSGAGTVAALFHGQVRLAADTNVTYNCTPWFLPFQEHSQVFCDPWETESLFGIMFKNIADDLCSHCLPDCKTDIYHSMISSVPFRPCDESNLGVSSLCNLEDQVRGL